MDKYCPTCFGKFPNDLVVCPDDETTLVGFANRDLTGEVLDKRYEVESVLGKGGMGIVYRARQRMINRTVALKVLRREVVQDETSVKRFLTEATAIASLKNAHTVTLYDFGVTQDGLLYYTMELLDGEPLSNIIKREGPLEYRRAAEIIFQSCESFEEAQDKGILHRDIKPDNLVITRDRGKEFVNVLDFGIAKLTGENAMDTITQAGMICGTPRYLSPEQVTGEKPGPESDLYSLGVVFYEMLTGAPPFSAETPMKVMLKHLQEAPRLMTQARPDIKIPRQLELFVQRALQKARDQRFSSVREFVRTLKAALADHEAAPDLVSACDMGVEVDGITLAARTMGGSTVVRDVLAAAERQSSSFGVVTAPPVAPVEGVNRGDEAAPDSAVTRPSDEVAGPAARGSGRLLWLMSVAVVVLAATLALVLWHPWASQPSDDTAVQSEASVPAQRTVAEPASVLDAEAAVPIPELSFEVLSPPADVRVHVDTGSPVEAVLPVADITSTKVADDGSETASSDVASAAPGDSKALTVGEAKAPVKKKHRKRALKSVRSSGKKSGTGNVKPAEKSGEGKATGGFGGFERLPEKGQEKKKAVGLELERLPEK